MMNKKNQRGYNLVEIAIVMTAGLLMASWLVTNFFEWQRTLDNRAAERDIEIIKTAIIDYAADHSVFPSELFNGTGRATIIVRYRLPSSRPYLPCPDITGNGEEDRTLYPARIISVTGGGNAGAGALNTGTSGCNADKGFVPWRTLGTPPSDPWGNRYTYRVDTTFADNALGFDQETESSYRGRVNELYVENATVFQNSAATGTRTAVAGRNVYKYTPSIICTESPCSTNTAATLIIVGNIADGATTIGSGGYQLDVPIHVRYQNNDIINGLPVVILSHGENGYGASPFETTGLRCNSFPTIGRNADERQNALLPNVFGTCPVVALTGGQPYGFVQRPHVSHAQGQGRNPRTEEFDDIVGWMSDDEIIEALRQRGTLPVGLLPPLGLEDAN